MNKKILKENLNEYIIPAISLSKKKLDDFYIKIYSYRSCRLENLWEWLYRIDFLSKKNPVISIIDNKIVGHMGLIPFWLNLKGIKVSAAWYADMHVLPEYRGKGIAKNITENLMNLTDVYLSFGNDESMNIFKRYGWVKNYNTYLHYFFLEPCNHPKFVKFPFYFKPFFILINFIYKNFLSIYYDFKKEKKFKSTIEALNHENIKLFIDENLESNITKTILDIKYLNWRFLLSPDLNCYKVFRNDFGYAAIVKERKDKPLSWHLDILLINKLDNLKMILSLIIDIILWGRKNSYAYIRLYISDKSISKKIKQNLLSIVAHPRFACFSYNKEYKKLLDNTEFQWQLLDSDFEFIS